MGPLAQPALFLPQATASLRLEGSFLDSVRPASRPCAVLQESPFPTLKQPPTPLLIFLLHVTGDAADVLCCLCVWLVTGVKIYEDNSSFLHVPAPRIGSSYQEWEMTLVSNYLPVDLRPDCWHSFKTSYLCQFWFLFQANCLVVLFL